MGLKGASWKTGIMTVVLLLGAASCLAEGPSFDCKKASTNIEKLICKNEELSRLDKEMSEAYRSLISRLEGGDKEIVKLNQVRWIKARDKRWEPPDKYEELLQNWRDYYEDLYTNLYTERIEELKEWKKYADGEKTTNFPPWQTKCWQRRQPPKDRFSLVTGDACVCRAFEQVLKTTCEPPKKLKTDWTLPSQEKRFQKLIWQPLDWREYWGLIEDMQKSGVRDDLREGLWKRDEATVRKKFEDGRERLSVTTVDINDDDGYSELVVRWDTVPPPGTIFGIMNPQTKRLDWRYEAQLTRINGANDSAEIMLYGGKAYKFGLRSDILSIWGEYQQSICEFSYLKGGK